MGRTIASVTRTGASERPYIARMTTGTLGECATAGAAQRAAEASNGNRRLRWTRADMPGDIEHYVGASPDWWPRDLPNRLEGWWDSDQGVQPTLLAGADRVTEWNSFDGSGAVEATQTVPGNAPTLIAEAGPNALDVVRFAVASAQVLNTDLTMSDPLTYSVVASHQATANASAILTRVGTTNIRENLGEWELRTDLGTVASGEVAVAGQLTVLTAVLDGTNAELWIDGVSFGQVAYTPGGAFAVSFSDGAAWWGGDLLSAVYIDTALPPSVRTSLINYQMRRYLIP